MGKWLDELGKRCLSPFRTLIQITYLFFICIKQFLQGYETGKIDFIKTVLMQIYLTGIQSISTVVFLGILIGGTLFAYPVLNIGNISGLEGVGGLVGMIVIREISPIIIGFIVIIKSSVAVTTQIGIMQIQREIEAMEAMGISPVKYLIVPRLIGGVISFFCLNMIFITVTLASGFIVTHFLISLPFFIFIESVFAFIAIPSLFALLIKIVIGGTGIFLVSSYHGLTIKSAATEIPPAVSKAAMQTFIFMFVCFFIVSFLTISLQAI